MVHFYIGEGKGKTTASLGLAFRAYGAGKRVYIAQFLKSGKFPSSEMDFIEKYNVKIKVDKFKDQLHPLFAPKGKVSRRGVKISIYKALTKIDEDIQNNKYNFIVLDELLNALSANLVTVSRIKKTIKKAKNIELILTGRAVPADLLDYADYISEIRKIKHPYDQGIFARMGIEY